MNSNKVLLKKEILQNMHPPPFWPIHIRFLKSSDVIKKIYSRMNGCMGEHECVCVCACVRACMCVSVWVRVSKHIYGICQIKQFQVV